MRNANFFNSTMRHETFKIKNLKYIWLASGAHVFSVTSETSEQTSKRKFALGLKNKLTSGEMVNPARLQWLRHRPLNVKRHECKCTGIKLY